MGRSTRAGPSRTQASQPSRSQPSQSQTQQKGHKAQGRRRQVVDPASEEEQDEEEEDNDDDDDEEEEEEGRGGGGGGRGKPMDVDPDDDEAHSDISRRVNALVRLALFTEHKRSFLRREDISKKALGSSARAFNQIFELAQKKLRDTFGMEMVELSSRAGLEMEKDGGAAGDGEEGSNGARKKETQTATGLKKKAVATKTKNYVLRSVLDPLLIEHAAQTDADILEAEAADQSALFPTHLGDDDDDDGEDNNNRNNNNRNRNRNRNANANAENEEEEEEARMEAGRAPKCYGSIISWSKADQLGSLGILYVILALILTSGRVLPEAKLRQHLRTLRLPSNVGTHPIQHTSTSTTREMALDDYLSLLLRQGYLFRQQVGGDAGAAAKKGAAGRRGGAGGKRVRGQAEDQEAGVVYEWLWGARAFVEVGEEAMAKFVAEFMVSSQREEDGDDDDDDDDGEDARKAKKEALKKMYVGVEKAAGGKLVELK